MKVCSTCKIEKDLSLFNKDKSRKDGAQRSCRDCQRANDRIRHSQNRDKRNAANAVWRSMNKEKIDARMKIYLQENRWKRKQHSKEYYWKNMDKILSENARYRKENQDKEKSRNQRWAKANPDICRAKAARRRAAKLSAPGYHTVKDIKLIFDRQRGLCANCHIKLKKTGNGRFHVDHIIPLSNGGSDDKYNLQCLCPTCNIKKNAKDPFAWAAENNRLL